MNSTVIPERTKKLIALRADFKCESCGTTLNLQYAHLSHRRIGGRKGKFISIYNDPRNIALLCAREHETMHGIESAERTNLIEHLRLKVGWHNWAQENNIYYEERE